MWYMEQEREQGFLVNVDFEKAFDRVEHDFLFAVLEKFTVGDTFVRCLRKLYTGATSCVKCNGYPTDYVPLERSIRQGCPLSAQLFTLVAEPLGLAIGADKGIRGVRLVDFDTEDSVAKVYQYADDMTMILSEQRDVGRAMGLLDLYCRASGARVNMGKTRVMAIRQDWTAASDYPSVKQGIV